LEMVVLLRRAELTGMSLRQSAHLLGPCAGICTHAHPARTFMWKISPAIDSIPAMIKLFAVMLSLVAVASAVDLPSKKHLNLAAIKVMVAAAEAEAQKQNVEVTICIVDESGNLLFLEKGDSAPLNTITWAQKKARHAAFYKGPSKDAADTIKKGSVEAMAFPD